MNQRMKGILYLVGACLTVEPLILALQVRSHGEWDVGPAFVIGGSIMLIPVSFLGMLMGFCMLTGKQTGTGPRAASPVAIASAVIAWSLVSALSLEALSSNMAFVLITAFCVCFVSPIIALVACVFIGVRFFKNRANVGDVKASRPFHFRLLTLLIVTLGAGAALGLILMRHEFQLGWPMTWATDYGHAGSFEIIRNGGFALSLDIELAFLAVVALGFLTEKLCRSREVKTSALPRQ